MWFRFLAVAFAGLFLAGCGRSQAPPPQEAALTVRVRAPQRVDHLAVVRASGSVEARESSKVGFEVAGRIRRVLFQEGSRVTRGQILAELDPTDYQIGADVASAQAAAADAQAAKARAGARKQELEQARVAFEQADDEYKRLKTLFERNSLAPNDFKKIEAKWQAAREQYDMAREGARAEDRQAAEAQAHQAAAALRLSQKRVGDTRLASPLTGVIARRLADPGEMIAAGMPVASVMDLNPARVSVGVPEAEVGRVRQGATARIRIPSMGDRRFEGKVELVGYAAEPTSRTFTVRILVPNPDLTLRAGMVAEAEIDSVEQIQSLTLPGDAIVRDPQGATLVYAYFPDRSRVYARRVSVGPPLGREFEIVSGLTGDEQIVVAGQQKLKEGALVTVAGGAR